jgi:anti-sigma28 factor (negative regulator of flagellin synthesis)
MISQVNSSVIRNAYASNNGESKETSAKANVNVNKQGDMSKIERIKESIESGEYKIDLQALSEKIAEELL